MNSKAQAGLEYLMTYGWVLVLVATIVSVLVFVVGTPASSITFSSSDPAKILLKSGAMQDADSAEAILQNITGGKITITGATSSEYQNVKIDGIKIDNVGPTNLEIAAGSQMDLTADLKTGTNPKGTITIAYTDQSNLLRTAKINVSGGTTTSGGQCLPACGGCQTCQGGSCVNKPNNTQCGTPQICSKCSNGSCVPQSYSEDLFNECAQGSTVSDGCRSDNCSGYGYSCGVFPGYGQGGCPTCTYCTDDGIACNVSFLNGGKNPPGCNGPCVKCQNGSCVPAECSCPGSGYYVNGNCWYRGTASFKNCTTVCSNAGLSCVQQQTDTSCWACWHFFNPTPFHCESGMAGYWGPGYDAGTKWCYSEGWDSWCSAIPYYSNQYRVCACQ